MFFFVNDTATTEIYTLSLHDALPISDDGPTTSTPRREYHSRREYMRYATRWSATAVLPVPGPPVTTRAPRSEEHTSEPQSRQYLVCRLLLEKKKKKCI